MLAASDRRFPALRADLARIDEATLHDPLFDRRIDLGPATAAMVSLLDGRPLEEVAAALTGEHGPRARVDSMLRRFMLLGLIEGASPRTLARLRSVRGGEALPHVVLEGSRFACQGSGACCRDHRLGPLSDDDVGPPARRRRGRAPARGGGGALPAAGRRPVHS